MIYVSEKKVLTPAQLRPPYHLAIVISGTSAELTMKTVTRLTHYLDELPTKGSDDGHAFRDRDGKGSAQADSGYGRCAQFGGKYFTTMCV
jgi:fumarate hydratase class I